MISSDAGALQPVLSPRYFYGSHYVMMLNTDIAPTKLAFSLVELSIVLVILGLLVGGVLTGQSLIRAAELRSITTDYQRLSTAVFSFKDKYFSLPGDMPNATSFWGASDAGDGLGADCGNVLSTNATTCNGDGSGRVDSVVGGVYERYRIWQHLANAGLIEGQYAGALSAGQAYIGQQHMRARLPTAGIEGTYFAIYNNVGHMIKIGRKSTTDTTGLNSAVLRPEETWSIDKKIDDGESDSGKLVALDSGDVAGCVTNGTTFTAGTTGDYILTNNIISCRIYYYPGY